MFCLGPIVSLLLSRLPPNPVPAAA
jgi:hypothetical protein